MASTTWGLANVEYQDTDGFCDVAHWTVRRVDGLYSASSYGSVSLTKPETLTPRTELKTSDIIADVKEVLGSERVTAIEQGLQLKISEEKTPTRGSFVPAS